MSLTTAHAGTDVEVFLDGVRLADADVTVVGPTQVDVVVPSGTSPGTHRVGLRSAFTAGPELEGLVVT